VQEVTVKTAPTLLVFKDGTYYEIPDEVATKVLAEVWIRVEQFPSYNQLTGTYRQLTHCEVI